MNSPALGLRVASFLFGLVCLGQLARLLLQLEIVIAGRHVPVWWSGVAAALAALLCGWLWRLGSAPAESPNPPHSTAPHSPAAV